MVLCTFMYILSQHVKYVQINKFDKVSYLHLTHCVTLVPEAVDQGTSVRGQFHCANPPAWFENWFSGKALF